MSFSIVQHFFYKTQFDGNAKVLMLALADYANDCCGIAWPAVESLVKKVGVNERNTHRLIKLVATPQPDSGYYSELEIFPGQGPNGVNIYRVRGVSLPTPGGFQGGVFTHTKGCLWRHRGGVSGDTQPISELKERQEDSRTREQTCSGHPGAHEGKRYCNFHRITHHWVH